MIGMLTLAGLLLLVFIMPLFENTFRTYWGKRKAGALINPNTEKTKFDCNVWEQSMFEQKMIAAGIMSPRERTICEESSCPNCESERHMREFPPRNLVVLPSARTVRAIPTPNVAEEFASIRPSYVPAKAEATYSYDNIVWTWWMGSVKISITQSISDEMLHGVGDSLPPTFGTITGSNITAGSTIIDGNGVKILDIIGNAAILGEGS